MLKILKDKDLIKQFVQFGVIGVSNTLVALVIYYILIYINFHYMIANVAAFILSVLNAYYWNKKFVFKKQEEKTYKSLIKMYTSYGSTFLLSTLLMFVMVELLKISEYIAPIINLCITIPLNFILTKMWVFKRE